MGSWKEEINLEVLDKVGSHYKLEGIIDSEGWEVGSHLVGRKNSQK